MNDPSQYEELIRKAYNKIRRLEAQLHSAEQQRREGIAVIGIGCRVPGANNPGEFWRILRDGLDMIREVPAERWDANAYYSADPDTPGKTHTRRGGYLDGIERFDAQFFGISPREAASLDPQQRLLLEVTWEALEHAGIAADRMPENSAGVFIGIMGSDYRHLMLSRSPEEIDPYQSTGSSCSVAAGRIAYTFGFRGPAVAVDTACSSSLVAVHQACQSLRQNECDLALAGGVNLILSPMIDLSYAKTTALSPDGRCKTFDASANGFGRGEGCGVVVLKRLSDALADGDNILAVIRGSAINHDGHASGLTVPNGPAQQSVIRQALSNAGVRASDVSYVEAHGTGTLLGDPIEAGALGAVYGQNRAEPLWIGSVKTNVGHLEGMAGVAALIKTVLSLKEGEIPPSLHFHQPNPNIDWASLPLRVPVRRVPWEKGQSKRIAGVSSFGISGTNAHLIVEEAPAETEPDGPDLPFSVLTLSAKTGKALGELVDRYANHFAAHPTLPLGGVCHSANCGRAHFSHRMAVVTRSLPELRGKLAAYKYGGPDVPGVFRDESRKKPKVAFLFTGQGSQYAGMGSGLYATHSVFAEALNECDEILRSAIGESLIAVLYGGAVGDELLQQTSYAQPALFAVEYALAQLWRSWGIEPDAVMGHSAGEFAAACVAGVFSLEDGLRLVAARGRLMQALPPYGRMAAVMADDRAVAEAIARSGAGASIAALNGPGGTVVSGAPEAVSSLLEALRQRDIQSKLLDTCHAFHSPLMASMLPEFERIARSVTFRDPEIAFISNVSGKQAGGEIAQPGYWADHILKPVRFAEGVSSLHRMGIDAYLETGPKPTLVGLAQQCPDERETSAGAPLSWLASLRPHRSDWQQTVESLAQLYVRGAQVDWAAFDKPHKRRKVNLPTYPFQREAYWLKTSRPLSQVPVGRILHPLLGWRVSCAGLKEGDLVFEAILNTRTTAYLAGHRVNGEALMPAAAFLEMALAASSEALPAGHGAVRNVVFEQTLGLGSEWQVQTVLTPVAEGFAFRIASLQRLAGEQPFWVTHASGQLYSAADPAGSEPFDLPALRSRFKTEIASGEFYQAFESKSIDYGSAFRGVERIWRNSDEALGLIKVSGDVQEDLANYSCHPTLLDAFLQVTLAARWGERQTSELFLPSEVTSYRLAAPVREPWLYCHARARPAQGRSRIFDLTIYGADSGEVLGTITGLHLRPAGSERASSSETWRRWLYEPVWWPRPLANSLSPEFPAPGEVHRRLLSRRPELFDAESLRGYGEQFAQLEHLSVKYIIQGLRELGLRIEPGAVWPRANLAGFLGVAEIHERLFERLLRILVEARIIADCGEEWRVVRTPDVHAADVGEVLDIEPELTLLGRCRDALARVLRGEVDPLGLVFPGGDSTAAARLYELSPLCRRMNELVLNSVQTLLDNRTTAAPVRIFEIGGGTGGTASALLPHLPFDRVEYVFSDVSPLFLNRAKDRFRSYSFIEYRTLNIERPPEQQGIELHRADVVIASNVLHAMRDLEEALRHTWNLLRPGGMLILAEATRPQRWVDITFGLLDGWWRFQDRCRTDYPLLAAAQWSSLLPACGFDAVETMTIAAPVSEIQGHEIGPITGEQTFILAGRAASQVPWLILSDRTGFGQDLAAEMRRRGQAVLLGRDPADGAVDFEQMLLAAGPVRGIVHLSNLDNCAASFSGASLDQAAQDGCGSVLHLLQALQKLHKVQQEPLAPLWVVTRASQTVNSVEGAREVAPGLAQSLVWGMARAVSEEWPDLRFVRVDLDANDRSMEVGQLLAELHARDGETEVAFRRQDRFVARLVKHPAPPGRGNRLERPTSENYRLETSERGTLNNLMFMAIDRRPPRPGEVELRIHATGLNFRDVLNALGEYPGGGGLLGNECSGEIVAVGPGVTGFAVGDRVFGLAHGSFARYTTVDCRFVAKLGKLTMAEGATVPVTFLTAYYCLHDLAHIRPGDKVLIHAASGGVGQAAIQLARQAGAEVFATVSPGKESVVRGLGVEHVYNSRDLFFADGILRDTAGAGVNSILNSLTGPGFVETSLAALAREGRFIEISKRNAWTASQVHQARPDAVYYTVDLAEVRQNDPDLIKHIFSVVLPGFETGRLKPLPATVFDLEAAPAAFRHMQQAKHIGKIVLLQPAWGPVDRSRRVAFRPEASYLITGGLGGLGLLVAGWMVERGARHLILMGRSGPNEAARAEIARMAAAGASVTVAQGDVTSAEQLARAVGDAPHPLRGIIHAAGVLDDGLLVNQAWSRFEKVLAPKVRGAWSLHEMARNHLLDFFVVFSSATSLFGSQGQSNHAAANAFLDALVHFRRGMGLPAQAIDWGAWSEIGTLARRSLDKDLDEKGMSTISPAMGLQVLEHILLDGASPQVCVIPIQWSKFLGRFPLGARPPMFAGLGKNEPVSSHLLQPKMDSLRHRMQRSQPSDREAIMTTYLKEQVSRVLGIQPERLDPARPFHEFGLDSLMAVELKHQLKRDVDVDVAPSRLLDTASVVELARILESALRTAPTGAAEAITGSSGETDWLDVEI